MDDYLAKPFKPEQLHKLLQRWVQTKPKQEAQTSPKVAQEKVLDKQTYFDLADSLGEQFENLKIVFFDSIDFNIN